MKEFTYTDLKDYLDKADKYDEGKTIKMYQDQTLLKVSLRAVVYLRTALIAWEETSKDSETIAWAIDLLEQHGHKRGRILEVAPAIRMG